MMDNLLPTAIRDSRWFTWPFFYYWFKGKNIDLYMDLKKLAYEMTEEDFSEMYRTVESVAYTRPTDMNMPSVDYLISQIDKNARNLLDVGCGRGFLLNTIGERNPGIQLTGCDLYDNIPTLQKAAYQKGSVYKLPFEDDAFDVVTCTHTIEHLREVPSAIAELKRVARKQLIIVVPCQRYFYYTMDLHLNFYPIASYLQKEIHIDKNTCTDVQGDWVYIGYLNK